MSVTSSSAIRFPAINGWAWFFTIIAAQAVILAANNHEHIPHAVAITVVALLAWCRSQAGFTLKIDEQGLLHSRTGQRVPYQEITGIRLSHYILINEDNAKYSRFLYIGHSKGAFCLPKSEECDRLALYLYLLPLTRLCEAPATLPGQLNRVAEEERALFPGTVLETKGRPIIRGEFPSYLGLWIMAAGSISGLATAKLLFPEARDYSALIAFTGIGVLFGFLFSILAAVGRTAVRKRRESSGLVISPRSLTLETPKVKGVLKWSEITYLKPEGTNITGIRALALGVDGGRVLLMDDYTCPITEIHRQIHAYWSFEHQ